MVSKSAQLVERLLTVGEAATLLGTSAAVPRRLIAERRIRLSVAMRKSPYMARLRSSLVAS